VGKGRPVVKYRDTVVICAKTVEPIEMPFRLCARRNLRNHDIRRGPDPPWEEVIFGKGTPIVKCMTSYRELFKEQLNRSICRLGCEYSGGPKEADPMVFARWC